MNILIYSIPFGFGPTGKAIIMAKYLKNNHNVTIATFNHSLQIVKNLQGINIYDCKSRNYSNWDSKIIRDSDIIISVMDLRLVNYLQINYKKKNIIYFDSLFWWRKSLNDFPVGENINYLLQYFPTIESNYKKLPKKHLNRFLIVNPLVSPKKKKICTNEITIHFGGVSSLLIKWSEYLTYFISITRLLIKYLSNYKITFIGNTELMEELNKSFSNPIVTFSCLGHSDFKNQILKSKMFFTTCGIESTYEAFNNEIPVIFLPPLNSTQLYQIDILTKHNCKTILSAKQKYAYKIIINKNLEYSIETKSLAKILNELVEDREQITEYEIELNNITKCLDDKNKISEIIKNQNLFFETQYQDSLIEIDRIINERPTPYKINC